MQVCVAVSEADASFEQVDCLAIRRRGCAAHNPNVIGAYGACLTYRRRLGRACIYPRHRSRSLLASRTGATRWSAALPALAAMAAAASTPAAAWSPRRFSSWVSRRPSLGSRAYRASWQSEAQGAYADEGARRGGGVCHGQTVCEARASACAGCSATSVAGTARPGCPRASPQPLEQLPPRRIHADVGLAASQRPRRLLRPVPLPTSPLPPAPHPTRPHPPQAAPASSACTWPAT